LLDEGRYQGPVRGTCFYLYVILDIFSRTWSAGWWPNRRLPNFTWYNQQHRHSGVGMMTPESVYTGRAAEVRKLRQATLESAYLGTPNRFKNRRPQPPKLPTAAWINPPTLEKKAA
jgi:hypothetical protein